MKKALIVLLLLALVAGGLFAQFSFSGRVNGGVGFLKAADNDDFLFGGVSRQLNGGTVRGEVNINATREDGTAGISFRLRANGAPSGFGGALNYRWAYAWVKGLDGLLEVRGGRIQGTPYDLLDTASDGETLFDAYGVMMFVNPIDILSIGLGAKVSSNLNATAVAEDTARGWFGFGVNMDAFSFALQMDFGKDFGNLYATASVKAIDNVAILFSICAFDLLNDFSDNGEVHIFAQFGFSGIENMSLNLALIPKISMVENKDLYFRGWFWLTYSLGNIIPRLDIDFVMAGTHTIRSFYYTGGIYDQKFNADMLYVAITPSVKFQVARNCFVDVGILAGIDLGDVPTFAGAKDTGVNFGGFVDVMVRF